MHTAQEARVSTHLRAISVNQLRSEYMFITPTHTTDRLRSNRYNCPCLSRLLSLPPCTNHRCIGLYYLPVFLTIFLLASDTVFLPPIHNLVLLSFSAAHSCLIRNQYYTLEVLSDLGRVITAYVQCAETAISNLLGIILRTSLDPE